jgi:antirestriction protein ArdC
MTVYEIVTEQIIQKLDQGVVPWRKPWRGGAGQEPKSFASRKPYRGVNVWLLTMAASAAGYKSNYWITYKKASELGGQVRKGEKSTLVVFWKVFERDELDSRGKAKTGFMLRYYRVFCLDQIDGLDESKLPADAKPEEFESLEFKPIEYCEHIAENMPNKPETRHTEQARAFYNPRDDYVHMPKRETFVGEAEYYSTLFHELGHSTGHKSRLDRSVDGTAAFGSGSYSREELVAEFTACFLCGTAGIEAATIDNSAAYIASWRKRLKDDAKLVVQAAAKAQKAADYILGKKTETA